MKKKTTIFKMRIVHVLSCLLLALLCSTNFYGQTKVLADAVTYTSGNKPGLINPPPTVENPNNALADDDNYARLLASPGLAIDLGSYQGVIELQFPSTLPANTWSYVRLQGDGDLFKALLGGSLGNVLGGFLGAVLAGNQEMVFDARMGASSVLSRTSTQGFGTDDVKLLVDADGNYTLAMRPSEQYDRIRITNRTGSLLGLGAEKTLDIFNAFYYQDNNQDCGRPTFTSFDGSTGLSLTVLPIEDGSLKNAIDGDLTTFSTLKSSAVLGLDVAGSISQNFYFPTPTDASSTVSIKLGLAATGVLDLKVLSGIDIIFKNNGQEVATRNVTSGLLAGTDVLGLLQSNDPPPLTFGLVVAFNQIEIRSSGLVDLNLLVSADVKIYDVQRYDGVNCVNPNITVPTPTPPMLSHKNCATTVIGYEHANFPTNVIDGKNDTFTTLEASSGIVANVGGYDGFVELGFADPVPAKKTTYVRIDFDDEVLGGLLNGSVGGLLNGVVSNLLFGGHYFTIEGKNGGTTVFSRSSNDGLANGIGAGIAKIVQDKNGHYYVAITPDMSINRIRITEKISGLLGLGTVKTMNVYHACYSTDSNACEQSFATYSTSDGITLDLLGLGAAGVVDAENAIDGDVTTASKISVGAAGIASSMFQQVQFHGLSSAKDHFRIKMKMQVNGEVTADVLGSIIVKAYNGDTEVYSQRLNEKLIPGLDLLTLLSSGQMINLPFAPGVPFDRVAVGISSLVAVNVLANPLEVYSVERFNTTTCIDPELQWDPKTTPPFNTPACVSELGSFENVNFPYEAITSNPNADTYATLTAGAGVAAGLGAYSSHIELKYAGAGAAAHEVSYIRVDSETNLFDALLGGSLGNALGNLLSSVALGNQYIVVQALDAAGAPVGTAHSSATGFNTEFVRLVKDKDGKFYLAVTAPGAYQAVRVEYHHTALVGAMGSSALKVYSMCRETQFDACEQAAFVSWDGTGIGLDILDLTNGGVANPEFSIDADNSNYATLNMGVAGVAASVSHFTYFKTKSNITDELRVRLQLAQPGILNVDLFGDSKLIFYNGEQNVKEMTLQSGLINNLDLLALFNSGGVQSFTFAPGIVYDRVELKISSLVAVNTSAPIRLYGMSRLSAACPDPDFLDPTDVFKSPVCADGVEIGTVKAVDDVDFAIDGDYNSYATMRADAGILFGISNQPSVLELKYNTPVPENRTSYLRIGDDAGVLESLLSGSIGEVVYGLLNNVALGDNYFVVRAKNGANTVLEGSSRDGFEDANGLMKIVQDKAGRYFVAISPDVAYTSVEIKAFSEAIVGITSQGYNLHVYGMCYETDFSGCEEGFSTSWDGSGLSVGVTGVGSYGVTDAFKALNNNNNSDYSTLSLGTLNVAGHIQQNIQYNKAVPANTSFRLKMGLGNGTVNASVFDNVRIIGYKDGDEVYNKELQTAVLGGVSLGTLFNNGGDHDVNFAMDKEVDEIALRLNSLVNATVAIPDVRLYYIVQDCATPEIVSWKSANQTSVQGGEEIEYTIHVRNTGTVNVIGAIIKDILPAYTTYVSGGTNNNGVVVFPELDVAVGETKTVTFKVKVDNDLTGVTEIVNIATVNGVETFPSLPNNPNEPDTSVTPSPGTKVPVEQVKSVVSWKAYEVDGDKTKTAVSGGEEVKYHIYVRNTGNQDLTNVTISDVLPAGLTWVTGGTHSGGAVTFTIPTLAVGATSSALNFTARVNKDLTGIIEIKNIAVVKTESTDSGTESFPPVDNANPTEPDTTTPGTVLDVTPIHDVEISKVGLSNNTTSSAQAQVGDIVTYTITVKNVGNKALSNLTVEDVIPTNLTITSPTGSTVSGNTFTDVISTLDVDDEVTFTIVGTVDNLNNLVSNNIENTATVTYRNEDNTADKTESATHKMSTSCTPVLADKITLTPASLTVCAGETFTITATNSVSGLTNPVYKWYTNANLTGTFFEGATLDLTNGLMTTTTYYVILEADGYCFTTPAATVTVTVNARPVTPIITVGDTGTTVCEGVAVSLKSSVVEGNAWYKDGSLIVGADKQELIVYEAGVYTVVVTDENLACPSLMSDEVTIVMNTAPTLDVPGEQTYSIAVGESVQLPTATSPNGGTIKWYTGSGVEITNMQLTFETPGVFYYSVVATLGDCSVSSWIQVIVSDLSACGMPDERVYATSQYYAGSGGSIANAGNAITGEPYSYSTISSIVGILGLGIGGQGLQWDHTIPAGTPVTIKLGAEYSGLALAGAISVVGTKKNASGHAMDIGTLTPVQGNILSLLSSSNSFEFTFIPRSAGSAKAYDGVKILVGGIISIAQSAKVYGAYYKKPNTATVYDCNLSEVIDIYTGTNAPVLDALGSTTGVDNEWLAVDGDPDTFALMYVAAGVATQTYMNVEFRTPFRKNDILKITMSKDIGLSLDLLTGLVIRRYLGDHQVGPDITQFNFLNLIGADPTVQVITPVLDSYEPFDRVEIFKAGVADVLSFIRINEIERIVSPESIIDDVEFVDNKGFVIKEAICKGGTIDLNTNADDGCTTYLWYDEDNEVIGIGNSLRIPNTYGVGEHKVYLQPVRYGCENLNRTEVTFTIIQCSKACIVSNKMVTNKIKK